MPPVLQESVKNAYAQLALSGAMSGSRFKDVQIGPKEVLLLHGFWYYGYTVPGVGANIVYAGLFRQTEGLPTGPWGFHKDFIWDNVYRYEFAAESVWTSDLGYVMFPQPYVLIRSPQLIGSRTGPASGLLAMRLYYTLRTVSDAEMAKLMVKDHE